MKTINNEYVLHLSVTKERFAEILNGKAEYEERDISEDPKKFIQRDEDDSFVINAEVADPRKEHTISEYNSGSFPFVLRPVVYARFFRTKTAVMVEIDRIEMIPRFVSFDNLFATWMVRYHLGRVVGVETK